jgi:hypothetical protein
MSRFPTCAALVLLVVVAPAAAQTLDDLLGGLGSLGVS